VDFFFFLPTHFGKEKSGLLFFLGGGGGGGNGLGGKGSLS